MIPLIGYADRLSVRCGDTLNFKVNSTADEPFEARLIRIICADPNPEGPGIIHEEIASDFDGTYPSRPQHYDLGSYIRVPVAKDLAALSSFTLTVVIWPTLPDKGRQGVISCAGEAGACLHLDQKGCVRVELGEDGSTTVGTDTPLKPRRWYRIWAAYDGETGEVEVGHRPLEGSDGPVRGSHGC